MRHMTISLRINSRIRNWKLCLNSRKQKWWISFIDEQCTGTGIKPLSSRFPPSKDKKICHYYVSKLIITWFLMEIQDVCYCINYTVLSEMFVSLTIYAQEHLLVNLDVKHKGIVTVFSLILFSSLLKICLFIG